MIALDGVPRVADTIGLPSREVAPRLAEQPRELCGDASKAREHLGWQAHTTFRELVGLMLEHDLADARVVPAKHLLVP